jgi:hypothetical protein
MSEPIRQMKGAKRGEVVPAHIPEISRDPAMAQAARISAVHKVKRAAVPAGQIVPVASLRERIQAISLFPNVYNRSFLDREMGNN